MLMTFSLGVADLDRTHRFYRELLGLELVLQRSRADDPITLRLHHEGNVLRFCDQADMQASHPALFEHLDRHPRGTGMTLGFVLPDLAPCRRTLARWQWPVVYEYIDDERSRQELWVHDPDGYLVTITAEPANRSG